MKQRLLEVSARRRFEQALGSFYFERSSRCVEFDTDAPADDIENKFATAGQRFFYYIYSVR